MRLYDVIWKIKFIEKIAGKHDVITDEVEEILFGKSHFRRAQKGHIKGEDVYAAYGSDGWRALFDRLFYSKGTNSGVTHLSP